MKKLPIGIQEFSEFGKEYIYVDKTEHIFNILKNKYYFLSRPRRFGKSLLLNTIKEVFLGNKELFEGFWIYDKINWERFPVIKISFSTVDYANLGLANAIDNMLNEIAEEYNITLEKPSFSSKFKELIEKLSVDSKVVILIDEYDKPIIDYINDIPKAEENRKILKSFYSVIKDSDSYIRFFFVTGVSKFSQVSIFSDLNNLNDITLDKNYATVAGYTQEELEHYFTEYIEKVAADFKDVYPDIMPEIKKMYNGYSWDGENFVYNPFSILNFFYKRDFNDFWFSTGTPSFLIDLIKKNQYTAFDIENKTIFKGELNKYEITSITLLPLLFQTGYLTIKESNPYDRTYTLNFPNEEVERSFTIYLLSKLDDGKLDKTSTTLFQMVTALRNNEIEKFLELTNSIFNSLSYTIVGKEEKYFHSIFYVIVKLLSFNIETEIMTIDGRIDAVIKTKNYIYVIEFKAGYDAKKALQQMKDKEYYKKYTTDKRRKTLIGINFNIEDKNIDDVKIEVI